MCWTWFKAIGDSSKNLAPPQNSSPLLVSQAGYVPIWPSQQFEFDTPGIEHDKGLTEGRLTNTQREGQTECICKTEGRCY